MSPEAFDGRRQADVCRAAHARRQLVELPAAPPRRLAGVPGEQRGDLLLPDRPWPAAAEYSADGLRHAPHLHARRRRSTSTSSSTTATCSACPRGYHGPCVAAPGYPMYYLNVLAGPGGERSMAFCDDPTHHWVRDTWAGMAVDPRCPMTTTPAWTNSVSKTIRIGVIGFGWMGQAHSRGCRRAPSYFLERNYEPDLVVVSDTVDERRDDAVRSFGFRAPSPTGARSSTHPDVDVVFVTAPNMLHVEMVEAAAAAGKHVFCEKPVGGTPPQTVVAERAARRAGRDHRRRVQLPVGTAGAVRQAAHRQRRARHDHQLLRAVLLDVRQRPAWACCRGDSSSTKRVTVSAPTSSATPSTSATSSSAASPRSFGTGETFIKQRPLPTGGGTHYDRGEPGDPTGEVTNEDYIGDDVRVRERCQGHVRGVPLDGRSREPEQLRGVRHQGLRRLEPRDG